MAAEKLGAAVVIAKGSPLPRLADVGKRGAKEAVTKLSVFERFEKNVAFKFD